MGRKTNKALTKSSRNERVTLQPTDMDILIDTLKLEQARNKKVTYPNTRTA